MGTLASLILANGHRVSGSDVKESTMTGTLRERGAKVTIGHQARNVESPDFVVYSSAVGVDNPEIVQAKESTIPILQRAQLLAQLMENQAAITVAGAHGKTTTTSMVSLLLINAGLKPTTAVGGIINGNSYNANLGDGRYFVAEVDESDGSFLYFTPRYSIITNIDFEHLDYYHNWENITAAYSRFIQQTDAQGRVIICGDDERLKKLVKDQPRSFITYGYSPENDVYVRNIELQGWSTQFECVARGKSLGVFTLAIPGRHNVLNALACIALGLELDIEMGVIQRSLREFKGVNRRFQIKGEVNDVLVVDDYGHHPTEIVATLLTAQSLKKKRVVTVFQPHRYTRTKFLMDDFVKSLSLSDYLVITDIYAASEPAMEGVSTEVLAQRLKEFGKCHFVYLKKEEIIPHLLTVVKPGDLVLTLGAGDVTRLSGDFVEAFKNPPAAVVADVAPAEIAQWGTVGVLMGGCSSEREISLKSGKAIYKALQASGCRVVPVEIKSADEKKINALLDQSGIDIAFIALHGELGEDGRIQAILERRGTPYAGSDVKASQLAINKAATQRLLRQHGINVPAHVIMTSRNQALTGDIFSVLSDFPVVVKPACQGSSIGITVVRQKSELSQALETAFGFGDEVIIEQFVRGRELTAAVFDGKALPLVEIRPKKAFFDFEAKYQSGMSDYIVPAEIPAATTAQIQQMALQAFHVAGCRDFARMDFILDESGQPFLLEINTIPGFTGTSLLPMAAKQAGYDFGRLCLRIVQMAYQRKQSSVNSLMRG